jgi:putative DNA primase/helicase
MASRGVVLDNAADMARCFPDLWESADAARQDRRRSVTNGYYRSLYNSEMSHSSVLVVYQPEGAGQKPRRAAFDLTLVPDPEAWLAERLGSLATCQIERSSGIAADAAAEWGQEEPAPSGQLKKSARLVVLSERLIAAMQTSLARRGRRLAAVVERLRQVARGHIPPRRYGDGANPRQRLEVTDDEGDQSNRL